MSNRWIARIRSLLRTVRGLVPVTWAGILVAAGSLWAFLKLGVERQDLILLIVGLVGLVVAAWSVLAVVIGAVVVAFRVRRLPPMAPMELECGTSRGMGASLPSLWWLPFAEVEWSWLSPEVDLTLRRRRGQLTEQITPRRRGVVQCVVRRIEIGDTFGLASVSFLHRQEAALRFLPSTGALRSVQVVQGMAGGDAHGHPDGDPVGDRIDMRRYGAGDPIRYVLWKVYARTRELMVRTPEVALSPTRQTVAYLVVGPEDGAAAGAARVAIDVGALGGDWRLGADGTARIADERAPALDLIVRSGGVPRESSGAGLQDFLSAVGRSGAKRAVVFVPPTPGPWLERVRAAAAADGTGQRMAFVVCTDGFGNTRPSALSRLLLQQKEVAENGDREGLTAVLKSLSGVGEVVVVDRTAGKTFSAGQLSGLMR